MGQKEDHNKAESLTTMPPLRWLDLKFTGRFTQYEAAFQQSYTAASIAHVRMAVFFGFALYAVFGLLDAVILPDHTDQIWRIRYGVMCPLIALIFASTFAPWFDRCMQPILASLVIFSGLGISAMVAIAPEPASYSYYAGNLLAIFFGYSFLRLRFVWATFAGWTVVAGYQIVALGFDSTPLSVLINNNFFFLSANVIGMFASYGSERAARRDFLLTQALDTQRRAVERARDELELRVEERTREAVNAARSKSDFLANMSHEIRTPMNGILGTLDVLRHERLTDTQQDLADTAFGSAQGLLGILDDVLDLSKIEAGKMILRPEPVVAAHIGAEVCELFRPQAEAKGLKLVTSPGSGAHLTLSLDPTRLRQILLNLVGNAIKFTHSGGVELRISSREDGAQQIAVFEVEDTGIGISPSALESLFDPFTQADTSSTRSFGGTGLGLTITQNLVTLMSGNIEVASTPDHGTCFSVLLPATVCTTQTPAASQPTTSLANQDLTGTTVLLIDDNPVNRKVAGAMLRQLNISFAEADNGASGVDSFQSCAFSAVLMDCQMPVMDGFQATQAIRRYEREQKLERTPIIALTANAMAGDREACIAAGMDDYIAKPITLASLRSVLQCSLAKPESSRSFE